MQATHETESDILSDIDSLFDDADLQFSSGPTEAISTNFNNSPADVCSSMLNSALRAAPPIPGLHYDPLAFSIPPELGTSLLQTIDSMGYFNNNVNQIMLFGRPAPSATANDPTTATTSGLPSFLGDLLQQLSTILSPPNLSRATYDILFPSNYTEKTPRQIILNRYLPGEGISDHVDLLGRYGDGIIGVSLGSGCVMRFRKVPLAEERAGAAAGDTAGMYGYGSVSVSSNDAVEIEEYGVWLPPNSVIVLEGDARYRWTHGIAKTYGDLVTRADRDMGEPEWIERGERTSITFRRMLAGADVVGE